MKKIILLVLVLVAVIAGFLLVYKKNNIENNIPGRNDSGLSENKKEEFIYYGKWQSTDDESFVRIFNEDNTFQDLYDEQVVSSGTWYVFDGSNVPVNFSYTVESDKKYIMMNNTNSSLSFLIEDAQKDRLNLIYLDGGALSFKRIK